MRIGIIVHSLTGHTLGVAQELSQRLIAHGHDVQVLPLTVVGGEDPKKPDPHPALQNPPDAAAYDAVVLAAPVHGFDLSPAMKAYLAQLPDLTGKKAICFVTKQLRSRWTGGNRALAAMRQGCVALGAQVTDTGMVPWASRHLKQDIAALADRLAAAL